MDSTVLVELLSVSKNSRSLHCIGGEVLLIK
uniref:Uncharacterized protein n=1 Tax=Arundo donax TaxID=35708 RepID=A0A0A8YNG0_ARUDO